MDLHGLASGVVSAVNPFSAATYYRSLGFVTQGDGTQVPTYAAAETVSVQRQDLSYKDLQHLHGLNLQGVTAALYLRGRAAAGENRLTTRGGDKFVIGGTTWLVVAVPEQWPDWTKVLVNQQLDVQP